MTNLPITRSAKALCICALLLLFSQILQAQPYRRLNVNDFQGAPHPDGYTVAYTNCSIDLHYNADYSQGYYSLKFDVKLVMNRDRSWIDYSKITSPEMLDAILRHEQGHYTLAYFEQQELLRDLEHARYDDNYKSEVSSIFDRVHAKYAQLNLDYDDDTTHSLNRKQQTSWDKYFRRRLDNYYLSAK